MEIKKIYGIEIFHKHNLDFWKKLVNMAPDLGRVLHIALPYPIIGDSGDIELVAFIQYFRYLFVFRSSIIEETS